MSLVSPANNLSSARCAPQPVAFTLTPDKSPEELQKIKDDIKKLARDFIKIDTSSLPESFHKRPAYSILDPYNIGHPSYYMKFVSYSNKIISYLDEAFSEIAASIEKKELGWDDWTIGRNYLNKARSSMEIAAVCILCVEGEAFEVYFRTNNVKDDNNFLGEFRKLYNEAMRICNQLPATKEPAGYI
jgi:hypothetical protein